MKSNNFLSCKLLIFISLVLLLTSCVAGDARFTADSQAGFWYGLWHGIISLITLIIHIFDSSVSVYEINNTGGWYDAGFLLGVISVWGGGSHISCKSSADRKRDKEWDEVGKKVEIKVMRKLKEWAEDNENADGGEDWDVVAKKAEIKLKRKIREWSEKD